MQGGEGGREGGGTVADGGSGEREGEGTDGTKRSKEEREHF